MLERRQLFSVLAVCCCIGLFSVLKSTHTEQHLVTLGTSSSLGRAALPRRFLHAVNSQQQAGVGPHPAYPVWVTVAGVLVAMAAMTAMMGMCGCCGGGEETPDPHISIIPWSDIQINEQIGVGGFGQVFKGMWQGNRVAVKVLNADCVSPEMRKGLRQEAKIMSQLMHPCIARVFGLVDDGEHLALVMQYYRRGTLEEFMTRPATKPLYQEWDMMRRLQIALMIARGMQFLHERQIIHGDLKTSNLLMDETDRVYITDFGLAKMLKTDRPSKNGGPAAARAAGDSRMSVHIAAPEVLQTPHAPRTRAADTYAFGIVLLEIVTGQPPFKGMNANMIQSVVSQGKRPGIPADIPQSVQTIITACWAQEPQARPTFQDILNMLTNAMQEIRALTGQQIPDDTRFY